MPGVNLGRAVICGSVRKRTSFDDRLGGIVDKGPDTSAIFEEQFRIVAIAGYVSALNRSLIILPLPDLQEIAFQE